MGVYLLGVFFGMLFGPTDLDGLATYYHEQAGHFRYTGGAYVAEAPYCAVDVDLYPALAGRVLMLAFEGGQMGMCLVADSGRLAAVGHAVPHESGVYYVLEGQRGGLPGPGWPFVVDLPMGHYERLVGHLETQRVRAYVLGGG